jgi:hypothetical protein
MPKYATHDKPGAHASPAPHTSPIPGPAAAASFCGARPIGAGPAAVAPVAPAGTAGGGIAVVDGGVRAHPMRSISTPSFPDMSWVSHSGAPHATRNPSGCRIRAWFLLPSKHEAPRPPMKTIGVDLWGDQVRGAGGNNVTCLRPSSAQVRRAFRELFVGAYAGFADRCREVQEPGIAIVAIDEATGRSMGLVRLLARVQRHTAAIVGRHDECDLFLNAHSRLALRHLAVVLDPVSDWRPGANVRYRVLDLRTSEGFADEKDRALRGVRCEGPGLLRCGGHALFVMPLGDPTDWPASADDAWAYLPERVYFDELERSALGSVRRDPRPAGAPAFHNAITHRSLIIRTHGPRETTDGSLVESGDVAGTLELIGPRNRGTIRIGHDELRDGVLLGRYARCNNAQLADDPSLSRVHALLIQIDDTVMAIDTASLNGTRAADQAKARLIPLVGDTELILGTATRARWHWMS